MVILKLVTGKSRERVNRGRENSQVLLGLIKEMAAVNFGGPFNTRE